MFTTRFARRMAKRYRRHGLDKTAEQMVRFLQGRGIGGATVLEIGGGVGEIQVELLKRGAARATNLELSPAYDAEASRLLHKAGLDGRVERRVHDIAAAPADVAPADVVVLHRVVCCYPDYQRLLSAVADHAGRLVVFSYPPRNTAGRVLVSVANLAFRLRRMEYRSFLHPSADMHDVLRQRGLRNVFEHRGMVWNVAGFER